MQSDDMDYVNNEMTLLACSPQETATLIVSKPCVRLLWHCFSSVIMFIRALCMYTLVKKFVSYCSFKGIIPKGKQRVVNLIPIAAVVKLGIPLYVTGIQYRPSY